MSTAAEMAMERKDRPAHVRFKREAVEDKPASLKAGHYVAKDVDFVHITPAYSKDVMIYKVSTWLTLIDEQQQRGQLPAVWVQQYKEQYRAWQNGQELPLHGVPIKGWAVISPAQQETLIKMNVLTVEDLCGINDEGIRRIGMGGVDLKNKAKAWLAQAQDKGPLTVEISALKQENTLLKANLATLQEQVAKLVAQANVPRVEVIPHEQPPAETISAKDILSDEQTGVTL